MEIVTIDFETYFDQAFSLSKLTTEAYIRSPEFEVIGVAVKVGNGPTYWYSGSDPGRFLKSLDCSDKAILCHNTAFDGAILSWHYDIRPKLWLDTLSMARPKHRATTGCSLDALATYYRLGTKGDALRWAKGMHRRDFTPAQMADFAEYCVGDVELTYKLWNILKRGFPISELQVIDQTIRMFTEPVIELDVPLLERHLEDVIARKVELMSKIEADRDEIMSNPKFARLLASYGVSPPMKTSLRTGKPAYAFAKTDRALIDLLDHEDERVQAVVAARLGVKSTIEETRTQALLEVASRGRLPIMLGYYGAHTGRFSGGDKLNLQNFPSRGGNNTLRRTLRAPTGSSLLTCDSSQIEARMVAWLAGQDDLVEAFRAGRDVYCEFASLIYDRDITREDKKERFVGKTAVLSLGYGAGAMKFRDMLRVQGKVFIDELEAQRIVRLYRRKYWKIVALWALCDQALANMINGGSGEVAKILTYDGNTVHLPNGMVITYHHLEMASDGPRYIDNPRAMKAMTVARLKGTESTGGKGEGGCWTKIYGGKMVQNLTQALAALVIREQMVAVGRYYPPVFQVHDEIILSVPEDEVEQAQEQIVGIMSTPPQWAPDLPVSCAAGYADNYGDIEK